MDRGLSRVYRAISIFLDSRSAPHYYAVSGNDTINFPAILLHADAQEEAPDDRGYCPPRWGCTHERFTGH
jgi:hypothetical protein